MYDSIQIFSFLTFSVGFSMFRLLQIEFDNFYFESQNTLTHSNRNDKKMINAKWLPPQNFNKEVVFVASIVKDKQTFWLNQLSKGVDYLSVSQDPKPQEHGNDHGNNHGNSQGNSHDHDHGQKVLLNLDLHYVLFV